MNLNLIPTLNKILLDSTLHARWLNSLSYLEYRGFRKIVRSQKTSDMNLERLVHAFEEVRHALFFKRLAIKQGGPAYETYHDELLLAGTATKKYFWDLDEGVSQHIHRLESSEARNAAYCVITWLIEQRALTVYHAYQGLLKEHQLGISLEAILREENNHLQEMVIASKQIIEKHGLPSQTLEDTEAVAFKEFWAAVEHETLR